MKPVPRIGRLLDLGALLVFLAGAGTYARAWFGLDGLPEFERTEGSAPFAAVEMAERFHRLEQIGLALMLVGVLGFVAAWWIARRMGSGGGG